jgi:tetratricopeptide (TPR) repeat protein
MKIAIRIVLGLLLAWQGWRAYTLARFDDELEAAQILLDRSNQEERNEGEMMEAVEDVMEALDLREDPEAYVALGDAALDVYRNDPKGGWPKEDADVLFRLSWQGYAGGVLRCPVDAWSWSGLAETAFRQARYLDRAQPLDLGEIERRGEGKLNGRYAVALAAAQIGVALQPSGYNQLDVLARVYEGTGEIEKAREAYALSARMMPAPSFHTWGGRQMVQELYPTILASLKKGLELAPGFEKCMLHLDVARFAREQDDYATAFENLQIAKSTAPDKYWTFETAFEMASLYEERGKFVEAIAELDIVRETGYGLPEANRRSASLLARLQRNDEACTRFRAALRDFEDDAGLRAEGARACEAAGDNDSAETFLKEGVKNPTAQLELARALLEFYRRHGKDRSADGLIEEWAHDYPANATLQKWKAELDGGGP